MIAVHLRDLAIYAYHGIYPQENTAGGEFIVQLSVYFEERAPVSSIDQTIDYTELYALVKKHMEIPTPLLETVAEHICEDIHQRYPHISKIALDIAKTKPPIIGFHGKTAITLIREYNR